MLEGVLAYIDPGSGSLIIQAVVASIVAIPFVFRAQLAKVVSRLRNRTPVDGEPKSPGAGGS